MKRTISLLALGVAVGAVSLAFAAPALAGPEDRGIWCTGSAPVTLPNPDVGSTISTGLVFHGTAPEPAFVTVGPFEAINVVIDQGKALGAGGVVTRANFALGVGAFCPGDPAQAGKTFTPVLNPDGTPTLVNNLGLDLGAGDPGRIYVLVH
jgi:hypothetical protein